MTMQGKISGKKIKYRPMMESELSASEKDRAYGRQNAAARIARAIAQELKAASMKVIEMKPTEARWYCLRVEKNQEFAVESQLLEAGVEAFMPRMTIVRIHRGEKITTDVPYFPSYLLVRCVPSPEAFIGLKKQKYVADIVGGNFGYHIIRNQDVERFKEVTKETSVPRVETDKTMTDGDKADVVDGPFTGFRCLVVSVKWCRQARAKVMIDVDGRIFEIESMPLAFLKKV